MPKPKPNETQNQFISRFMSSSESKKDFPDHEQRLAVAHSMWREHRKSKKEQRYSHQSIIEIKEEDNNLIVKGYIATTHFDGQDKITLTALQKWEKEINEGNPRANKVSINHNRESHVAGVGIKGSAKIDQFTDGEYGLFVETLVDKTRDDYSEIEYRITNDLLDSFSIEYIACENAHVVDGRRILDSDTELFGWTLASQPMNEHAVMVKEIIKMKQKKEIINKEEVKTQEQPKEEIKMTEQKQEGITISAKEMELLKEAKEMKAKQTRLAEMKELLKDESFQKEILSKEIKSKVLQNKEEPETETETKPEEQTAEQKEQQKLSIEFKEIITRKDLDIEEKFKRVGLIAEKEGLIWADGVDKIGYKTSKVYEPQSSMGFKNFSCNGSKMEFKGLGITTNQNTDTDYLLSSPELRDRFDPIIYDALNESTTTWSILRKEDFSMKGNNQVQFKLKIGANSTAGFYTGNAVSTSYTTRIKYMTKFKKVQVGIEVDGDMIAAARGGPVGDVFGEEVADATLTLLNTVNGALNDEVGLETAGALIGFEYITDSAGNTTLYNVTRSAANKLSPDSASDTYINGNSARVSLDNLRLAIEQAVKEGANINNLVFITHPTQERLFKGIYDASQRLMPTSSRFGFEGRPEFDSVPVFSDKDINTDDWFLVDLESHKLAIWVPPTLEMLGKRADAEEGFVKMYLAAYNTVPRRMVQIYGNATS